MTKSTKTGVKKSSRGENNEQHRAGIWDGVTGVSTSLSKALGRSNEWQKRREDQANTGYVISMAFGKPSEPLHRTLSEFKRKPISEISDGTDERLEAARLAPSGMNAQGWFFSATNGVIRCYRKKSGLMSKKLGCIDIGIAVWHITSESTDFRFMKEPDVPERKGFIYVGTVK